MTQRQWSAPTMLRHLAVLRDGVPVHRLGPVGSAGHRQRRADAQRDRRRASASWRPTPGCWRRSAAWSTPRAASAPGSTPTGSAGANAYLINGLVAAACLLLTPAIMRSGSVPLLFLAVGVAYWQYGGGLALMPAMTADFFGPRDLGINYGLVFLGWGIAFFVPQLAGYIRDLTGTLDYAFYLSGILMLVGRPAQPRRAATRRWRSGALT